MYQIELRRLDRIVSDHIKQIRLEEEDHIIQRRADEINKSGEDN